MRYFKAKRGRKFHQLTCQGQNQHQRLTRIHTDQAKRDFVIAEFRNFVIENRREHLSDNVDTGTLARAFCVSLEADYPAPTKSAGEGARVHVSFRTTFSFLVIVLCFIRVSICFFACSQPSKRRKRATPGAFFVRKWSEKDHPRCLKCPENAIRGPFVRLKMCLSSQQNYNSGYDKLLSCAYLASIAVLKTLGMGSWINSKMGTLST